jgi:hypothetical protein
VCVSGEADAGPEDDRPLDNGPSPVTVTTVTPQSRDRGHGTGGHGSMRGRRPGPPVEVD